MQFCSCIFQYNLREQYGESDESYFIYQFMSITKESIELGLCNLVRHYVIK